jgi:hypothetical protein
MSGGSPPVNPGRSTVKNCSFSIGRWFTVMPGLASWNLAMAPSIAERAGSAEYSLQKLMLTGSWAPAGPRLQAKPLL